MLCWFLLYITVNQPLLSVLSWKCIEFFQMLFSVSIKILWILSFILLIWYIILIGVQILNQPCIPRLNSAWFYILLDSVYWYFVKDFCAYVYEGYWFVVFKKIIMSLALISGNTSLIEKVGKYFLSLLFFKNMEMIGLFLP